jgi:Uma2 family endonuclease
MVCGPIEDDPADPSRQTIVNPTLLVEVLSPSTEDEDRSGKWHDYQQIPSLEEYVMVSQAPPRIERYRRLGDGKWEYEELTSGTVELGCGAKIDIAALYADLPV